MYSFKNIEITDKELFDSFFKSKYENSEANFTNLLIWQDFYKTRFATDDGFLVIVNTSTDGKIHCYMPYGEGDIKKCLLKLKEYCLSLGEPLRITNANARQAQMISEIFPKSRVQKNEGFFDYVYLAKSLSELSGKKLHAKKNHLNRFKQTYPNYVYRPIEPKDFANCIEFASKLMLKDRNETDLEYIAELRSIETAFKYFHTLELKGGIIEIEGNIAAFSVGESHTEDCALIHIEKANTDYTGIYVAINNEFVNNTWLDYTYINREEDMGIEGLRKAKRSYKPDHMVEKYMCIVP